MITPTDIAEKHFAATQFKRGYSEEEVDTFLDKVAETIRTITKENEDLKTGTTRYEAPSLVTIVAAVVDDPVVTGEVVVSEVVVSEGVSVLALLTLAQRTHDQHVADGEEIRDRLIAQGQQILDESKWAALDSQKQDKRLTTESRERATGIVAHANEERDAIRVETDGLLAVKADVQDGLRIYLQEQIKNLG